MRRINEALGWNLDLCYWSRYCGEENYRDKNCFYETVYYERRYD